MGQAITHASDLPPRNLRLGHEEVLIDVLDGFADFDQPSADRVRHELVMERFIAGRSGEMALNAIASFEDVAQARD